jgi:thioredoxin-dependent peroxiredoxin
MNINDKAPDFTLQDENGKEVALKDLRGKTVILFFYPRLNGRSSRVPRVI